MDSGGGIESDPPNFSTTEHPWPEVVLESKVFPGRYGTFGIEIWRRGRRTTVVPTRYKCRDLPKNYWEHGLALVLQYYSRLSRMDPYRH